MTKIFNQDFINGKYNPDFLNSTIDSTEENNMNDTDPVENDITEVDSATLVTALQKVLARFRCLEAVPANHIALEEIFTLTGLYSWEEVKEFHAEEVNTVFGANPEKKNGNSVENRRLALCNSLLARVQKDFDAANEEVKGYESAISKLTTAKEAAETEKVLNEYVPGESAKQKLEKALTVIKQASIQLPNLTNAGKKARIKRARLITELDLAKARVKAASDTDILIVNSGDPTTDAEIYSKIAGNVCWKVASLNNAIAVARSQISGAEGNMRYSMADMENTSAGMYEGTVDRITRLETAKELQYTMFAAAEFGYEIATGARDNEAQWWPEFPNLWTGITDAQRRINLGAVKRAQDRAKAVSLIQENGY